MATKLAATFALNGGTMYTENEAKDNKGLNNHETVTVGYTNKKTKKYVNETLHIFTRKCIPAYQTIKMDEQAYDEMTTTMPVGISKNDWSHMGKAAKIKCHLNLMAEDLGGSLKEFHIFD